MLATVTSRWMEVKDCICYRGGSLFLTQNSNAWGCFIRLCEWRMKEKDRFIILLAGENCLGWEGQNDILCQMDEVVKAQPF